MVKEIYTHKQTKQEFEVTKCKDEPNLYKVVSIDKGNIRYLTLSQLETNFKKSK